MVESAEDCRYCIYPDSGQVCGDVQQNGTAFACTREPDHDGPHAGCGTITGEHPHATWRDGE